MQTAIEHGKLQGAHEATHGERDPARCERRMESPPWRKRERDIFRLQKRMYKAKPCGDKRAVRGLKRLLKRSKAAKTLAVRLGTHDNRGKKTAGVDGVKSLDPAKRLAMAAP